MQPPLTGARKTMLVRATNDNIYKREKKIYRHVRTKLLKRRMDKKANITTR